jgi:hypothetical protein
MTPEAFSVDDPIQACRWWADRGDPELQQALSPRERQELFAAMWGRLTEAVEASPRAWWTALQTVIPSLTPAASDLVSDLVALVLSCAPGTEDEARVLAGDSPLALSSLYYAYIDHADSLALSEAKALQRLPRQAAINAFVRKNASEEADTGADMWTVGLLRSVAEVDPEWAWEFLRSLADATSEGDLGTLGVAELEQFCKVASVGFIELIEVAAHDDAKFRAALRWVWPGATTIPEPTYRRLRVAARLLQDTD